ncbi:Tex family protein [uncultured Clostridium sp.]|uniref:Tex family protein n=1 Tax=uncultured Clostridium sp. TaxID=59620 RepID=UPI002670A9C2|nr:Tex family protein [uncultured Clostridium sp.]
MDIIQALKEELQIGKNQVEAAVKLIDEGNTIPFIARYRKEATGSLNDEVLRQLDERLRYLRNLEDKKEQVIGAIRAQEKLTPALEKQIREAATLVAVEDLYLPYRPKRRTRAGIAREKGLEPLAVWIYKQEAGGSLEAEAAKYVSEEKGVADVSEAIEGARDILAERISEMAKYRNYARKKTMQDGLLEAFAKDEKVQSVYEMYYHFSEPVKKLAGHRVLAINRGEKEKILSVKLIAPEEQIVRYMEKQLIIRPDVDAARAMEEVILDSYRRLIGPAIEREIRTGLTETAESGAIQVFGKNLEQLLMQPPIAGCVVLGWDPAFRTGCKLAVVDETGKVLDTTVIYPTAPQNRVEESKEIVKKLIRKYGISLISVGNGTASRESEQIIVELLKEIPEKVQYVIVNEAGASVYSASKLATEEFPQFDVGQRSAASIARRLQDPLAELVKIDPKSIGVGQYQHDMNQKNLSEALQGVVETCVNKVGVDLNTASAPLLAYISGINKTIAKNIVAYREENGAFSTRRELLKVAKLGPKAYEQCAGFMRIQGGKNPLDATSVHPESYKAAEALLKQLGHDPKEIAAGGIRNIRNEIADTAKLAKELSIGEPTLLDIVSELEKPARDPREEMPKPILRTDVLEIKDLKPGMILKGTVRNVIDFGAFVDIGVHQDGLVHVSQMTDRYIKHPLEAVSVGDIVEVKVLAVDVAKKRISLTMKIRKTK